MHLLNAGPRTDLLYHQPKFDLHLKIHDLNNVPLVSGNSYIKWHLAHSMHGEHRGRTPKCPIASHRVDYDFSKLVPHIRISVDKNLNLVECPIEFEIIQEFAGTDKINLGVIKLNLSEYVEESEALIKDASSPGRKRASSTGASPAAVAKSQGGGGGEYDLPEGVVRRYLLQESKINSTLKVSILMVQVDGDRNFVAPPLKTATAFGGIAGIVATEQQQVEDDGGPVPNISKYPRDTTELQDLYRRTLAASWSRLPGEPSADECIEDIFAGGSGWATHHDSRDITDSDDDEGAAGTGTLRPSDFRRMGAHHHHHHHRPHHHHNHRRSNSGASDKSTITVRGRARNGPRSRHLREDGRGSDTGLSRSGSLTSLATSATLRSDHDPGSMKDSAPQRLKEVDEGEAREDLVAWRLPS
ncbi:hypothetical protein ACRE_059410 [Hapsidospora chrysogenum ATCC 11550]|uniref:C2 NT-type domain-containing protein n=1 Tax=Hapsidospora chrysogenum (strain ATCC 11550 / CBS 779.69 / DSM 880 / IAM 14645 / JCM 23072 / IMI 49137) TaxID=857340 RepID=A0A086T1S5_HAPC1|nr:hypothetical protein ACRE_059410 [Hapsidospora chrysogenum ATCC 11550]